MERPKRQPRSAPHCCPVLAGPVGIGRQLASSALLMCEVVKKCCPLQGSFLQAEKSPWLPLMPSPPAHVGGGGLCWPPSLSFSLCVLHWQETSSHHCQMKSSFFAVRLKGALGRMKCHLCGDPRWEQTPCIFSPLPDPAIASPGQASCLSLSWVLPPACQRDPFLGRSASVPDPTGQFKPRLDQFQGFRQRFSCLGFSLRPVHLLDCTLLKMAGTQEGLEMAPVQRVQAKVKHLGTSG